MQNDQPQAQTQASQGSGQNYSTNYPQNQPERDSGIENSFKGQGNNNNSSPRRPNVPMPRGFLKIVGIILLVFFVIGTLIFAFRLFANRAKNVVDENKPVELTWWGFWEDSSIVQPVIAQYEQENPNVTINYVRQDPRDYRERLANALAQGRGPDIFRLHNTWVPMFFADLYPLPEDIMTQTEFEETFYSVAVDSALTDRGIMAIPLQYDGLALFINEDLFATFAQSVPETWNELRDVARRMSIVDSLTGNLRQGGIALGITDNVDYWEEIIGLFLVQNGANLTNPSGNATSLALRFYRQFHDTDAVWDSAQPDSVISFTTGRAAMIFGKSGDIFEIEKQNPGLNFRVVPVPQLPKLNPDDPDLTYSSFWMEGVWAQSEGVNHAWRFLKYLTRPENLEKIYKNAQESGLVAPEPFPRPDMRDKLMSDNKMRGIMEYAPDARIWYLASGTNDGNTGINTLLGSLFAQQINSRSFSSLGSFGDQVQNILARYGLARPVPVEEE